MDSHSIRQPVVNEKSVSPCDLIQAIPSVVNKNAASGRDRTSSSRKYSPSICEAWNYLGTPRYSDRIASISSQVSDVAPSQEMTLGDRWREEYRQARYLEHLSQDEIEQRVRDIFTNILILAEDGKLSLPPLEKGTGFWMLLFTHILEEFALRGQWVRPGFLKSNPMPIPTWPAVPRAVRAVAGRQFEPGKCLFKFRKLEHLRCTLEQGKIRVASASSYSDPSLNYAVRDDEIRFTVHVPAKDAWIQKIDEKTLRPSGERIKVLGNMSFTHTVPTDYYVYCLSVLFDFRAFDDFEADACLVVRKPKEFIDRLLLAGFSKLPNWFARADVVDYLDPLRTKRGSVRAFFAKHFRYAYQTELRIVWVPEKRQEGLKPIFAEVGALHDMAELIVLPAR
jgi:hypothetical protein